MACIPRTKNSKYLGMYNTGRPSNFRLGLRSPNVECKYCVDFGLFQAVQRPKPEQQLVIQNTVQGKDVFAELPTGFDKSLSLQVWMLQVG